MHTGHNVGMCDRKAKRYLAQIADEIEYYEFIRGIAPTRRKLDERNIKSELHQTVQTPIGTVTVYWAIEAPNVDGLNATAKQKSQLQEGDTIDINDIEGQQSIRYPVDVGYKNEDGGYLHRTYVFKGDDEGMPSGKQITVANKIHKLRNDMCKDSNSLGSVIVCEGCNKKKHLSDISVMPPQRKPLTQFQRRERYLRASACSHSCYQEMMEAEADETSDDAIEFNQSDEINPIDSMATVNYVSGKNND